MKKKKSLVLSGAGCWLGATAWKDLQTRKERETTTETDKRGPLSHHLEGFTFDWGSFAKMRHSKSNQVQLLLYFLLQWSLGSVNAETSLQILLACSFYHCHLERSCNNVKKKYWLTF